YGVQADCNPAAEDRVLLGIGNGWNQLTNPGITVPGNQTVTLHLSEILPVDEAGDITGKYAADCVFQPFVGYQLSGPEATAVATVLPPDIPTTNFTLKVINDDDPQVAGSPVQLLDPATQDVVAGGLFGLGSGSTVTVGRGTLDIVPGWRSFDGYSEELAPGQPNTLDTSTITPGQTVDIHVVSNTQLAPPTPPTQWALPHPAAHRVG
ncbi:MAG TPA: hypothetical protein VGM75_31115, partial [Pseudonocardiaceae bacterium]